MYIFFWPKQIEGRFVKVRFLRALLNGPVQFSILSTMTRQCYIYKEVITMLNYTVYYTCVMLWNSIS